MTPPRTPSSPGSPPGVRSATTLGFLAPMPAELKPLRRALSLTAEGRGRHATHRGWHGDRPVVALETGIGMRRAEVRTRHLLDHHDIDHVIVIGVAGGLAPDLVIGDVVVPEVVIDRRDGSDHVPSPLPATPPDPSSSGRAAPRVRAGGRLLSGDELVTDHDRLARLRADGGVAIDMETAAIARVCAAQGVPWSVFRGISDDAFDPAVDESVLALAGADGALDAAAVVRFLARDPRRAILLARLGRDLAAATTAAVAAALAATRGYP